MPGAVALATACHALATADRAALARAEHALTETLRAGLRRSPASPCIRCSAARSDSIGVVTFTVAGQQPSVVAAGAVGRTRHRRPGRRVLRPPAGSAAAGRRRLRGRTTAPARRCAPRSVWHHHRARPAADRRGRVDRVDRAAARYVVVDGRPRARGRRPRAAAHRRLAALTSPLLTNDPRRGRGALSCPASQRSGAVPGPSARGVGPPVSPSLVVAVGGMRPPRRPGRAHRCWPIPVVRSRALRGDSSPRGSMRSAPARRRLSGPAASRSACSCSRSSSADLVRSGSSFITSTRTNASTMMMPPMM